MGLYVPQYAFGKVVLQEATAAPHQPTPAPNGGRSQSAHALLTINGVDVKAEAICEVRDEITIEAARARIKKDRMDEVFFASGGKRYVAYGPGMKLPAGLARKSAAVMPTAAFEAAPARILAADNETNTSGEGAVDALKFIGVKTGVKVGAVGAVAGLAALGAGKVSQSVAGVLLKAKNLGLRFLSGAAKAMGTSVPVAGIIIGGTILAAEIGVGAWLARHRQPDYGPVKGIIK